MNAMLLSNSISISMYADPSAASRNDKSSRVLRITSGHYQRMPLQQKVQGSKQLKQVVEEVLYLSQKVAGGTTWCFKRKWIRLGNL